MKIRHHLFQSLHTAGHGARHVMLVSIVDACVWINRPNEYGIDPAVTLLEVIEIAIDCVFARDRIVEIAVVHHHLRLDKAMLTPLKLRQCVAGGIVPDINTAFRTPVCNFGEPVTMSGRCASGGSAQPYA